MHPLRLSHYLPFVFSSLIVCCLYFVLSTQPVWGQGNNWQPSNNCPQQCQNGTYCVTNGTEFECQAYVPGSVTDPEIAAQYRGEFWPILSPDENEVIVAQAMPNLESTFTKAFFSTMLNGKIAIFGFGEQGQQSLAQAGYRAPTGAIQALAYGTEFMVGTPVVSTHDYIADIGRNADLVSEAYAQGTGALALDPVLPIWKAFRNIAYLGFVIIFVVVGFMIMFRSKIGGQVSVSIQMALPQIIITLLLVTFSYAIVSLIIDLIWVIIYLVVGLFSVFGIINDGGVGALKILTERSVLGIVWQDLMGSGGIARSASSAVGNVTSAIVQDMFAIEGGQGLTSSAIGFLTGSILAWLIIGIALIIAMWKLFFTLIMAYIAIIFGVIFSPIVLLFNAIPGSNAFWTWLKGILASALLFPATAVMFLIAAALLGPKLDMNVGLGNADFGTNLDVGYQGYWNNDNLGTISLPFIAMNTSGAAGIIGLGFIMFMPKLLEMIQKIMGVEGGFAGMAGAALEPIAGAWGKGKGMGKTGINLWADNVVQDSEEGEGWRYKLARGWLQRQGKDVEGNRAIVKAIHDMKGKS